MDKYAPSGLEKAPMDIVSRAIMCEIEAGRAVKGKFGNVQYIYLDLRHIADLPEEGLPMITNIAKKFNGIDAATEMIPVRPAAHYTMEEYPLSLILKRRSAAYSVPAKGRIKHTWGEPPQIQLNKRMLCVLKYRRHIGCQVGGVPQHS